MKPPSDIVTNVELTSQPNATPVAAFRAGHDADTISRRFEASQGQAEDATLRP
ncbi:hypothetical protein [Alteriqipengyuania sp. 357]